ncbi:MAG: alanyl-tRNA synthetase, partial [Gammaproteobacteria bacterium]
KIDLEGFETEMNQQRQRARASSQFSANTEQYDLSGYVASGFLGYESLESSAQVVALLQDGESVSALENADEAVIILDQTPFYGESGGQVGDIGHIRFENGEFKIRDTQKQNDVYLHIGVLVSGEIKTGDRVDANVDGDHRRAVMLNHSATHLMHEALRQVLGNHVQQKGSLVDAHKLRFDFSHYQPLTDDELLEINQYVNQQIRMNLSTSTDLMDMESAKSSGAMALFGEKYGDIVRVLKIGSDSVELCGGTHVERSGDIGIFKTIVETGIASGVRRIEAITGQAAFNRFVDSERLIDAAARQLKTNRDDLNLRIEQLQSNQRLLEKELTALKSQAASQVGGDLAASSIVIDGVHLIATELPDADVKTLRETVDQLKNKLGSAAVVLGSRSEGKISLIAGVTKAETSRIKAGDLVNFVAQQCGGKGGGRPDMARAGGSEPENLPAALSSVEAWLRQQLS